MNTRRLPGTRDVRVTLDYATAERTTGTDHSDRVVVACPPHPQMGGDRRDGRLRAVSDALVDHGSDCLRFDYGPWDEGRGERTDARNALAWARSEYDRVGLFGYSFGGSIALLAAASVADPPDCVSALAPGTGPGRMTASETREENGHADHSLDVVSALDEIACPVQVVYGTRDDVVDSEPVADRARELGHTVEEVEADHFFVGQQATVAGRVALFLDGVFQ